VQSVRLSHDGARIAVVVGGVGHGRLLVGRVVDTRGTVGFEALRNVLPGARDVRGVSWDGGDQILTTVSDATGGRELVAVDVDGYATRTIPTTGLSGQPVDVAASPGRPILVTAAGRVWRSEASGGWTRLGSGDQPVYPN
jgi:murein DD-endopeptidase MepM/ murein hydrolase activator NlpD